MTKITWDELKSIFSVGKVVSGTILRHEAYGVFVDLGYEYEGLIQITEFKDQGRMVSEEYPAIGEKVDAVVLGFKDHGCEVWLGVKPSQLLKES